MVYVIIPVFNRKNLTRQCLISLLNQTYTGFQIIVVDDGSTDGTDEMLVTEFKEAIVLKGNGNLWWTGATNLGIEYTLQHSKSPNTDFVLTLNNDLEVPQNYLEKLVQAAMQNGQSIIGSLSVNISNTEQLSFCGVKWNRYTAKYHSIAKDFHYSYKMLKESNQEIVQSDLLPGRGTLIPLIVFLKIGLFDLINFPHYAADEDFSWRARKAGYSLLIPTSTFVKSHIGETGAHIESMKFTIESIKQTFFSIKSPINFRIRWRWARRNSPLGILYFPMDYSRILYSILMKYLRGPEKNT
jgi:GT2 family glycosyltransferase